jgi:hypothetical protein
MNDKTRGLHVRAVWAEGQTDVSSQDAAEFDKRPQYQRAPEHWGIYTRKEGMIEWVADFRYRPEATSALHTMVNGLEYSYEHLEAAACMWEHVIGQLRRVKVGQSNAWAEYALAYGQSALRETVIRHAPILQEAWVRAHENGYDEPFDWEFVPKYMEDHVTRILT